MMSRSGRVVQPDVDPGVLDLYLWGRVAQQAGEPTGRDPTALVIDHGNHVGGQGASFLDRFGPGRHPAL